VIGTSPQDLGTKTVAMGRESSDQTTSILVRSGTFSYRPRLGIYFVLG
jgi:hypothetical protein